MEREVEPEPDGGDGLVRVSTAQLKDRRDELQGKTEFRLECPFARCCWEYASSLNVDPRLWNHTFDRCFCPDCVGAELAATGGSSATIAAGSPVMWKNADEDIPPGTVGRVQRLTDGGTKAAVKFPAGTWSFPLGKLVLKPPEGAAGRGVTRAQRAEQLGGWVHFGLKVDDGRVRARGAWSDWDTAFHGTTVESFEKIVETGFLLIPGDVTPDGVQLGVRDGHIEGGHLREGRKEHPDERVERVGGGAGMQLSLEAFQP